MDFPPLRAPVRLADHCALPVVAHAQPPFLPLSVGAGQVIPGLDEGLASMRSGGLRRLYIPGSLAFNKTLKAAPGR